MDDNDFVMDALFAEVKRINADLQEEDANETAERNRNMVKRCPLLAAASAIIDAYIEICDKNRSTISKLMEAHQSVTAERDEEIARAEKAEEDIEILASHLDPCEICESKRNCVHPASCPERNHSSFRYCGAGKEQKHG